jgi:transglutaminase-like putative cysteine protease
MAVKIRLDLTPIALEWTRGETTDRGKIEALERRLASFRYTLEDRREGHIDPVVEFLTVTRAGTCELFSSALALLARSIGIPARIAVGYQVHADEKNPLTGLTVVRDRNAHQWVEAWFDGAWQTRDPTPVSETFARKSSVVDHGLEAASWLKERAVVAFWKVGLARTGAGFAIIAAVLLLVRRYTRSRARGAATTTIATSPPLPAFESLAGALDRAGWTRDASEPLERFAKRVHASDQPWSSEVADAMLRYADLRYGGIGEERAIAKRLDELARRIAHG